MRKIAITDIHGCLNSFWALLDQLSLSTSDELYLLGDYIDRGPNSKGVIDHIWQLQEDGYPVHCLRGNHEQLLIESRQRPGQNMLWQANGGRETLASFKVQSTYRIPEEYFKFCQGLPYYFEVDNYILVHAGLSFDHEDPFSNREAMLWIRQWYDEIDRDWLDDRIILHGHTPISPEEIKLQYKNIKKVPALDLDGGCVHKGKRPGMGVLCALDMTNWELYFQDNIDL